MNTEQLRQWCESVEVEAGASALLVMFQQARSNIRRAEVWDALLEMLSTDEETDLSRTLSTQWTDELLKALTDADPKIRCQSLSALADVAPYVSARGDVIDGLVRCLYDESKSVRSQAISTAYRLSNRHLLLTLTDSLTSVDYRSSMSDDPERGCLWTALFAMDEVVDRINLTLDEQNMVAGKVLNALDVILNESSASDLDIWKIGDSLGEHIKGDIALDALKRMMTHTDPRVRNSAVHGLSHLGGAEAAKLIKHALSDPATEVREEAQKALLTIQ